MELKDQVKATGRLVITLMGPNGELKDHREIENLVVTVGKGYIASRMKDATATAMSHMAVGTTNTTPDVGDTTLAAEAGRVALTSTNVTSNAVTYAATFPPGTGTGALVEAGLFNASSSGTMLARTIFLVINKGAADTLGFSWTVTIN